jgi:hypothetical protein
MLSRVDWPETLFSSSNQKNAQFRITKRKVFGKTRIENISEKNNLVVQKDMSVGKNLQNHKFSFFSIEFVSCKKMKIKPNAVEVFAFEIFRGKVIKGKKLNEIFATVRYRFVNKYFDYKCVHLNVMRPFQLKMNQLKSMNAFFSTRTGTSLDPILRFLNLRLQRQRCR